jgi:hypothetical protein
VHGFLFLSATSEKKYFSREKREKEHEEEKYG